MKKEKLCFEKPVLEIIRFAEKDVITTSNPGRETAETEEVED